MIAASFKVEQYELVVTPSIGIAMYPDDATDPETLIKYANTAMGGAKQAMSRMMPPGGGKR